MKRIIYALFASMLLFAAPELRATHVAGGEIYYEHLGGMQYKVVLVLYRDMSPGTAGLGANANISVNSSCFGQFNFSAARTNPPGATPAGDGGVLTPGFDDCVTAGTPGYVPVSMHFYEGTTTLPGLCQDIRFSYSTCCRSGCIDNLQACAPLACGGNCPDGTYVEALLNNTNGHNSSPQFLTAAAKAFCTNSYFVWAHPTTEPDGDSVKYDFIAPMEAGGGGGVALPYAAGYSMTAPITTAPGTGGIVVNNATGSFSFTTSNQQEICVVAIIVREYRYNTTLAAWEFVGSSMRDMQVTVAATCAAAVRNGPKIDVTRPGYSTDTIPNDWKGDLAGVKVSNDSILNAGTGAYDYLVPVVAYNCGDSTITMYFDTDIQCESISPDGTDFRVIGPDSVARPVIGVGDDCGIDFTTDYVNLKLYKPLTVNGIYTVYIKKGNDGNTLTNECGFELQEFYTMLVDVQNCFTPVFDMRNVTVDTNWTIRVQYDFDTNSFPTHLFTGVEIHRSNDNGGTYNKIATFSGQNAFNNKEWTDFSVGPGEVENFNYRYRIKGIVNQEVYPDTRDITSIRVDTLPNGDPSIMHLAWNRFNGWLNVNYEVMFSDNPDDPNSWTAVTGQGINPTIDTNFFYTIPEDSGCYAHRIDGINFSNPALVSQSNWEQFCVTPEDSVIPPPIPPVLPDTVVVPNVFTPNGDMQNDYFVIQNIETWSQGDLQVYNRWGAMVYETKDATNVIWDGTDLNSGSILADGVYFYILNVNDANTGMSDTKQGTVTIFSGGL
jgi:gliding motility-associated-like protein